jgi:uncharacterized protein YrrD
MTFHSEAKHATGHTALDEHGSKIGTVTDVIFDTTGQPRWAVVDPGPLRRAHYAPMDGAYESEDGAVIFLVDSDMVKHAPPAGREHVITPQLEAELEAYYS